MVDTPKLIPVADCPICDYLVPVYIMNADSTTVVICSKCEKVLNDNMALVISYYDHEDLADLGWDINEV